MCFFLPVIFAILGTKEGDKMILVVVGPTAVGKTKMSVELAKIYNGEIINADSMQIYKGLDVGTAKVKKEEMQHIKHHLLSIKNYDELYTVYDYQRDARSCISDIQKRGKIPILVGGTGYYIKAALYDYEFNEENFEPHDYSHLSTEELAMKIDAYDSGITYDKFNRKRMERLLTKLEQGFEPQKDDFKLIYDDVMFIGLTTDRDILYERINKRVDDMLIDLIDEVKPYASKNIQTKALMTGIGYKEFYPFFNGNASLRSVVDNIKQNSRNYAKKQYTWFNNQMDIKWFMVNYEDFSKTVAEVLEYIQNKLQ